VAEVQQIDAEYHVKRTQPNKFACDYQVEAGRPEGLGMEEVREVKWLVQRLGYECKCFVNSFIFRFVDIQWDGRISNNLLARFTVMSE
jgi:hypothetical protein